MISSAEAHHQIQTSPYIFEHHRQSLVRLFSLLGLDEPSDLSDAVTITQPWARGDHVLPETIVTIDQESTVELYAIYDEFGMVKGRSLDPGHYNEILVLGGTQLGNNRRTASLKEFLDSGAVTTSHIRLLGGQRHPYEEYEVPLIINNISVINGRDTHDVWAAQLGSTGEGVNWETDMLRLSAILQLGALTLQQLHLRLENADPIHRYEFKTTDGIALSLLHTLAVKRNGPTRHTTEACIRDWLKTYNPPIASRVGFVVGNPHIDRTTMTARRLLNELGREDIELVGGGSPASPSCGHQIFLGEIARRLHEESMIRES